MMKTLISILLVLLGVGASAQVYNPPLKKGNEHYEEGKYDEAEILYRKATEEDEEEVRLRGQFNLGDALYKQERYEEAAEEFSVAAARSEDEEIKAKAYHNLGNSYLKQEKLKEAVEAYKNSLKLNPKDDETRHNLARTMRMLQKQRQQQQQEENDIKPSEFAKELKKKAEALARQFLFEEAYNLMREGLRKDQTVAVYQSFIKKLEDVVQIKE